MIFNYALFAVLGFLALTTVTARTLPTPQYEDDGVDAPAYIRSKFGSNVIEFYLNNTNRIQSCGKNTAPDGGQCLWFWVEPTDGSVNQNIDRARIEVRLNEDNDNAFYGDTYNYQWYFYVLDGTIITNQFFHCHQVKSDPDNADASAPIITYTLEGKYFGIRHIDSQGNTTVFNQTKVGSMVGKWIFANETVFASHDGWYETTLYDAETNQVLLEVPRTNCDMFRPEGQSIHAKFGVYRHHGAWPTTYTAFNTWKITKV